MRRVIVFAVILLSACLLPVDASAEEAGGKSATEGKWRFEFDNDVLTGGDDAFSAGFSIQRHSPLFDTWEQKENGKKRKGFSLWIGKHIPGLGDDGEGGRIVRRAQGFGGVMQTPEDIENPDPQPDDVPWAGIAGWTGSWSSYDNRRLNAFQIFVGCMGPCAQMGEVQEFVHDDLGFSDEIPQGWDNQLENEAIGNINYAFRRKLAAPSEDRYAPGRGAADLSFGGQAGVGNFFTFVEAQLEFRFGNGLPMGFTHIPDVAGRGIIMDPAYVPAGETVIVDKTRYYFSLVPRFTYFEEIATLEGGDTDNGGFHPGVEYDDSVTQVLFGFHIGRPKFSFHLTYYFFPDDIAELAGDTSYDWVNLSFEWRR